MDNNSNDTNHTRNISRRIQLVRNGEECNLYKEVWCEEDIQLADTKTKNVREDEFNPRLGYDMVRLAF